MAWKLRCACLGLAAGLHPFGLQLLRRDPLQEEAAIERWQHLLSERATASMPYLHVPVDVVALSWSMLALLVAEGYGLRRCGHRSFR